MLFYTKLKKKPLHQPVLFGDEAACFRVCSKINRSSHALFEYKLIVVQFGVEAFLF